MNKKYFVLLFNSRGLFSAASDVVVLGVYESAAEACAVRWQKVQDTQFAMIDHYSIVVGDNTGRQYLELSDGDW